MNKAVLREFLSEDNLNMHISHLKNEALRYSILEKSINKLSGLTIDEISRSGLKREERKEAISCLSYIESHKCYFDSFGHLRKRCDALRKYFGSEEKLLYEIFEIARHGDNGFLYVYIDNKGKPIIELASPHSAYTRFSPVLALDLYEHAYFLDYGFEREKYLRSAISHLDIEKLEKALT